MKEVNQEQDLREQHKKFNRIDYDGHNRHSGITTLHDLSMRRSRRIWRRIMREMTLDINNRTARSTEIF